MLMSGRFWAGIVVGAGGVYVYHRWVRPMPSTK
jgi:hypothetical protein